MTPLKRPAAAATLALILIVGAACSTTETPAAVETPRDTPAATQPSATQGSQAIRQSNELGTAALVKLAEPSVVRIATGSGVGSGFVIDGDGYIITNNHVIVAASGRVSASIRVTMSDGSEYPASVVGTDPRADLALLKIEASNLKALKLATLDEVAVGQDVVAIGYALDLKQGEGPSYSVTRGIVSQKNRAISEGSFGILGSIQTDAAINQGNSGGPLLNLFGEVVGVNTALAPDGSGGVASGIGFAVGADTVGAVYEQLRAEGRVNRGLLGIQDFTALQPAKAKELGLPEDTRGILLSAGAAGRVGVPAGPAASAGLRGNDVITRIGDSVIRNEADLAVAMIKNGPGETVTVEYYREGKKQTAQVTLGTPPAS